MYYPLGWPKVVKLPQVDPKAVCQVVANRDKVLFAVLTPDSLLIYYSQPCLPIVSLRRSASSCQEWGENVTVQWKPDSTMLVVTTSLGHLMFYHIQASAQQKSLYEQKDPPNAGFRRESAALFLKESIPALTLSLAQEVQVWGKVMCLTCIRDELMAATKDGHVLRYKWDGTLQRDYCLDLRRIPFCLDQLSANAIPITEPGAHVTDIEYSPLLGGFAIVLNDGRGAFLTAPSLKFDPNQVTGVWAPLDDVTCTSVNHRYRLIAFGRQNSQGCVYSIDETTGALQLSHQLVLSSKDYPGMPGPVSLLRWTPEGSALALAWTNGGLALWSTFGALLLCTLCWDLGPLYDRCRQHPLRLTTMDWSAEGYNLWAACSPAPEEEILLQYPFVKSALTANPYMSAQEQICLQGEDKIYINASNLKDSCRLQSTEAKKCTGLENVLMGSKLWSVIPLPSSYISGNWPLRYIALDASGQNLAVAGRTGFAIYSLLYRKWKLFGNESQEKDFVVTGGLVWWDSYLIAGCYDILHDRDEIRAYPREAPRLDNAYLRSTPVPAQVMLLNLLQNQLLVHTADSRVSLYSIQLQELHGVVGVSLSQTQEIDISSLGLHPACLVSATLANMSTEGHRNDSQSQAANQMSLLLNVCGKVLLLQREHSSAVPSAADSQNGNVFVPCYATPTVLASCVETIWVPGEGTASAARPHLTQALWLCCGAYGMRVWLPLYPKEGDKAHTFMSKRIMLPFQLNIYPLAVMFEEAILLGVENDTVLYACENQFPCSLPYCVLERTSQVYLHHILRQLICRNLGFHAWEIARSCTSLSYFPHSLELLLHEVLEEEATSKDPIPDALLPSVLEFIQEFPVYLDTIVQCARKTEVALWPYLFGAAANPRQLFQRCLDSKLLDTAASYLLILQNLEPLSVSRQYATMLLDTALECNQWELAKDLVRFLRAIDPKDIESPRPFHLHNKYGMSPQTPPITSNEEDFSYVLGSMHVPRGRATSTVSGPKTPSLDTQQIHREVVRCASDGKTPPAPGASALSPASEPKATAARKKSAPNLMSPSTNHANSNTAVTNGCVNGPTAEELFLDVILQRHCRRLLSAGRLRDLGHMAAYLDAPLVAWLHKERDRAAKLEDCVWGVKRLHADFAWPYPTIPLNYPNNRRLSSSSRGTSTEDKTYAALEVDVTHSSGAFPVPVALRNAQANTGAMADSGYLSNTELVPGEGLLGISNGVKPWHLVEATAAPTMTTVEVASLVSEESSMWGEEKMDNDQWSESVWSLQNLASDMDSLSLAPDVANKGPSLPEVQLRYLLQVFVEAECLDWALVLAIVLRDAMAVLRLVNLAKSLVIAPPVASAPPPSAPTPPSQHMEAVTRLRDALLALAHWADTDCPGYRPFVSAIYAQISILTKLMLGKISPLPAGGVSPLPSPVVSPTATTPPTANSALVNKLGGASFPLSRVDESEEERKMSESEESVVNASVDEGTGTGCVIS